MKLYVSALLSIVIAKRDIREKGGIKVTEQDNAMVLLDHGQGVISRVPWPILSSA